MSITLLIFCGSSLPTPLSLSQPGFATGTNGADQQQNFTANQDADASVAGLPTVSAETIDKIFVQLGSPMAGTGALIAHTANATHIDDAFALAVWWTETNDGEAGVGLTDRNPGSVRGNTGFPIAYDGYTAYSSYALAIVDWFHLLRANYLNRGLTTVYEICHPYVATASAGDWAAKVILLIAHYRLEGPPASVQALTTPPGGPRLLRMIGLHDRYRALRLDQPVSSIYQAARQRRQMKLDQSYRQLRAARRPLLLMNAPHLPIIAQTQVQVQAQAVQLGLIILFTSTFAICIRQSKRRRKTASPSVAMSIGMPEVPPTPALIQTIPQEGRGPLPLTPFISTFSGDEVVYPYKRIVDTEGIPQQKRILTNLQPAASRRAKSEQKGESK
jgi:hypothetical protein